MFNNWLLLLGAGFASGAINSVAGGGSFIAYPALLAMGVTPIMANATTSLLMQPGAIGSIFGYKKYLKALPKKYYWLIAPCIVGTLLEASVLVKTSNRNFSTMVPFFILFAVALLFFQPAIHRKLFSAKGLKLQSRYPKLLMGLIILGFFLLSVYGGYFGAGFGIIALGFLGLTGLKNINQMNGLKNILGLVVGVASVIYFIGYNIIAWQVVPVFIVGNLMGGYYGAKYISRLPSGVIRSIIILIGLSLAVVLFIQP